MSTILRQWLAMLFVMGLLLVSQTGLAEEWKPDGKPWEKFAADFGVFLTGVNSSIRLGTGIGVDIDMEDLLDLDSTNTVFRADALWRFSDSRRHRLDLTWFAFRRDGERRILEDITIEDDDENKIVIPSGTTVVCSKTANS